MFLPGSPCGCCGNSCLPCEYCTQSCLEVTFSGFSHGTGACNECEYIDDATFYIKRPPVVNAGVSASASGPPGSGASFGSIFINASGVATNIARRSDGSYYVTNVPVTNGGSGYVAPALQFSSYNFIQCRPPQVSVVVVNGAISSVVVEDGGEYWPTNSCSYSSVSGLVCAVCPQHAGHYLFVVVGITSSTASFTLYRREPLPYWPWWLDIPVISGSRSLIKPDGSTIQCNELEFEPEHLSEQYSCTTNGTVSISAAGCSQPSVGPCQMPDQITMSLSGMGRLFFYECGNSASPYLIGSCYGPTPPNGGAPRNKVFCDECDEPEAFLSSGGFFGQFSRWSGSLIVQDFADVVLDKSEGCPGWTYKGLLPATASASWLQNQQQVYDCAEDSELTVEVSVSINPVNVSTTVVIDGPIFGGFGASADATISDGEVSEIIVTNGGGGYAREIFERTEPTMTVTLSGGSGSGAAISATLTQFGAGEEAYWYVSSVSVTNGGTGYSGTETVAFTPEEGTTTDYPASAFVSIGRIAPTLTATASPGSGADLEIMLGEGIDWFTGQAYWYVDSVVVNDGGTGYVDGDDVAFTVTDGVQSWQASATIATDEDGIIQSAAVYDGGSYYKSTGVIEGITLWEGGAYYKEESTGTAEVQEPKVYISSHTGSGATATATVDGTVGSETFGEITGIDVESGGQGYLASGWGWLLTAGGVGSHRQRLLSEPQLGDDPSANCESFQDERFSLITPRISLEGCPTDLLTKTFTMHFDFPNYFSEPLPEGYDYCVVERPVNSSGERQDTYRIFDFGKGDIEVTLAIAGGEEG